MFLPAALFIKIPTIAHIYIYNTIEKADPMTKGTNGFSLRLYAFLSLPSGLLLAILALCDRFFCYILSTVYYREYIGL